MHNPARLGMVGCGAIARAFHVPALARHQDVLERMVFIDPDLGRARDLAAEFGATRVAANVGEVVDELDGVVVAAPHQLHFPIALNAVSHGLHVLCEKPLTETVTEAEALVAQATKSGVSICVNYTRRLYPSARKVRQLLQAGTIGKPRLLDLRWGYPFAWPSASGFYFGSRDHKQGRGVLLDKGSHALDLICWWLGGVPRFVSCRDDSLGGSEAVVDLELDYEGCRCHLRMSWLTLLDNSYSIQGDGGSLEGSLFDLRQVMSVSPSGRKKRISATSGASTGEALGAELIDNFLSVIAGEKKPLVSARDVIPSVRLIEECYQKRTRFDMPWQTTEQPGSG